MKIHPQQKQLFTKAGFIPTFPFGDDNRGDSLVYWKRGDIVIMEFANKKVSLSKFTDSVISQSIYRAKDKLYHRITNVLNYDKDVRNLLKIDNKKEKSNGI